MAFKLHAQLDQDTLELGRLRLSRVLLMLDANYPWLILVPEREGIKELFELNNDEQLCLMKEVTRCSQTLHEAFSADKINVAALGNMVPQLHVHLIVRYTQDPAWPEPVWGKLPRKEYEADELKARVAQLSALLGF